VEKTQVPYRKEFIKSDTSHLVCLIRKGLIDKNLIIFKLPFTNTRLCLENHFSGFNVPKQRKRRCHELFVTDEGTNQKI
jgi:hypothetical protein